MRRTADAPRLALLALAIAGGALVGPLTDGWAATLARAEEPQDPGPPRSASSTQAWIDDWDLPGTRAVYVRNLADRPIEVTSFRLSDCHNVGLVECEVDTPVGRIIAPGQIVALVVVSPVLTASGDPPTPTFRYTYAVRFP